MVTEIEDEVFCTRKFNLAAVINHSGNLNSGLIRIWLRTGKRGGIAMIKLWCE